ncbi:MAG: membrane protein of unknown function [Nitrosopumilus sp.]|nr:membrane protein of unknown function [Candidatus Nitrosopumilus limneticus]
MKLNKQLLQINRNFIICFITSASISAVIAQMLADYEKYQIATITMIIGYIIYFGLFLSLFYIDNQKRYKTMESGLIKKELLKIISSFGVGEIIYLGIRWPSLYYFLEMDIEPFLASIISEIISTTCYMISVTVFLRKTKHSSYLQNWATKSVDVTSPIIFPLSVTASFLIFLLVILCAASKMDSSKLMVINGDDIIFSTGVSDDKLCDTIFVA